MHVMYSYFVSVLVCLISKGLAALVAVIILCLCNLWHLGSVCGR